MTRCIHRTVKKRRKGDYLRPCRGQAVPGSFYCKDHQDQEEKDWR